MVDLDCVVACLQIIGLKLVHMGQKNKESASYEHGKGRQAVRNVRNALRR